MSTITITIYEALAKKKILESQIDHLTTYTLVYPKKKFLDETSDGIKTSDIEKKIQARYDKSVAVMKNYSTIKAAINEANAKTTVTIAGREYSIANAIARQRNLSKEEQMYRVMLAEYHNVEMNVKKMNEKNLSADAISAYIQKTSNGTKMSEELVRELTEEYKKRFEVEVFDPMNSKEKAEEALEEIKKFREEIHFALTQANINTTITVELDD